MITARFVNRSIVMLMLLTAGALGACSNEEGTPSEEDPAAAAVTIRLQGELNAAATLNAATAATVRPVKPTLKCVDKLSSTSYRAHFGYTNSSTLSIAIPVGFYNRFFPSPEGRAQPTTFLAGSHPDILQVTFSSSSLMAWILGSGVVVATRTTALCPTGTGGATGSGGAGTGGRGGNAGAGTGGRATGGVTGTGGSGAGGASCPSTCDDRNPCTIDICNASTNFQCSNVAQRDGTVCDDGNACTVSDTCVAGVCTSGLHKVCQPLDQCHVAGVCDPTSGACSAPVAADGITCDDGNGCTLADTCRAGVCTGGTAKTCTALDQCHVAGVCTAPTGVCTNPPIANNTPCNDNSLCTAVDVCQAGVCVGTAAKVCSASDQCHVPGVCAPTTGICSNPAATDGTSCNDGNVCTTGDACLAGVCTPAVTLTASHCAGTACDQCSFDSAMDVCSLSADGCDNCVADHRRLRHADRPDAATAVRGRLWLLHRPEERVRERRRRSALLVRKQSRHLRHRQRCSDHGEWALPELRHGSRRLDRRDLRCGDDLGAAGRPGLPARPRGQSGDLPRQLLLDGVWRSIAGRSCRLARVST